MALASLVIGGGNLWAYTTSDLTSAGWTQVTSLTDVSSKYYILVDAGTTYTSGMAVAHAANTSGSLYYQTLADPLTDVRQVWKIAESSGTYTLQALNDDCYISGNGNGWDRSVISSPTNGTFNFTLTNDIWHIVNATGSYSPGNAFGPWEGTKESASNYGVAINKSDNTAIDNGDNAPGFIIYSIARPNFSVEDVTTTYMTNPSFESEVFTETGYDSKTTLTGWTVTKTGSSTTSRLAFGTQTADDGHMGYVGSNIKPTDGSYYLSLRGRWHSNNSTEGGTVSQAISSLVKGSYTLSADYQLFINASGKGSGTFTLETNGGSYLSTKAATVGTTASASTTNWNTNNPQTVSFNFDYMTGTTTFTAAMTSTANTQLLLDHVRLYYNANYTDALVSAIARATAMNTRSSSDALTSAIATAQGVLDGVTNKIAYQTTIDNAVTTLNSAIATAWSSLKGSLASGEDITYLVDNPSFEYSTPVSSGIVTTIGDAKSNNTAFGMMQNVSGWEMAVSNGNYRASGVFAYNGTPWLGGTGYTAPDAAPEGSTGSNALGIVAVWSNTAQYKQTVTFPAGRFVVTLPIYNKTGGTTAFSKNLFGFIEDGGTEHLATATTYSTNSWTTETVTFDLDSETSGYLSLGYTAINNGSGNMPHLFIDGITITYTSAANAYASAVSAATTTYNDASYANVTGTEKTALKTLIDQDANSFTVAQYFAGVTAIENAVAAFTAAKDNYDTYVAEKAHADEISTTITEGVAAPTSASNCEAVIQTIKVNEYSYVSSNYSALDVFTNSNEGWVITNSSATGYKTNTASHWSETSVAYLEPSDAGSWGWNAGWWWMTLTQKVLLPAGTYVLKSAGRHSDNSTLKITINKDGDLGTLVFPAQASGLGINKEGVASFDSEDAAGFANSNNGYGWEYRFQKFILAEAQEVAFNIVTEGRAKYQWFNLDFPELLQLTSEYGSADLFELKTLIAEAETVNTTANVGSNAFQRSTADANTFKEAIENAKSVRDDGSASTESIRGAISDLNAAMTAFENATLNTPAAGVQYRLKATASDGAAWAGNYYTMAYNSAQTQGYHSINANQDAADYLAQAWQFTAVDGTTNGYTLSMTDEEGDTRYICTGKNGYGGSATTTQIRTTTDAEKALVVKVIAATGTDGRWYLQNTEDDSYIGGRDAGFFSNSQNYDLAIEAADKASVTVSAKAGKYGTVIFPFTPDVSTGFDDITFYSCASVNAETSNVQMEEVAEPAANTPYLIKNASGSNFSKTLTGYGTAAADNYDSGLLTGVYTAATIAASDGSNTRYVLQTQGDVQAFYKVSDDFTATANRCYLTVSVESGVKALFLNFEDTPTAIESIEAAQSENVQIYNLVGQRLNKAQKGVNIINGKKVLVK